MSETDKLRGQYNKPVHFNCKDGDEAFTDNYVLWLEEQLLNKDKEIFDITYLRDSYKDLYYDLKNTNDILPIKIEQLIKKIEESDFQLKTYQHIYGYRYLKDEEKEIGIMNNSINFVEWILNKKFYICEDNQEYWWEKVDDEKQYKTKELYQIYLSSDENSIDLYMKEIGKYYPKKGKINL